LFSELFLNEEASIVVWLLNYDPSFKRATFGFELSTSRRTEEEKREGDGKKSILINRGQITALLSEDERALKVLEKRKLKSNL
jgi:hypothetical protein